jgi:phosphoglycolate phosphatase
MTGRIDNILFDLDGTLTDPKEGIVNSILYALHKLGIAENCISELDSFIGPPLRDAFAERYKLSDALADKAISYYREYYAARGIFENKLYPGVHALLASLSNKNYRLFVATSKPTVYAAEVLRHFKADSWFKEITGSNLDNTRTDKTEIIATIVSRHGLIASHSVMIGERMHDILGAKNNAMKSIAVTYGYGSPEELSACQPDFMANNCGEIEPLLVT